MRIRHARSLRDPRAVGQALVEFALVFPLFMFLLFGIIDVGRYVYITNAFNQAAREGARYGAVEQWAWSCPASVPLASQDRFTCTSRVAKDRMAAAPANFRVDVTCEAIGVSGARTNVSASACSTNDLLIVTVRTPKPGDANYATTKFTFFTPVIAQLLGSPTITGQARVVVP